MLTITLMSNNYLSSVAEEKKILNNKFELSFELKKQRFYSSSTNKGIVYAFLINDLGLNVAAACGIMANIECESSFNPTSLNEKDSGNTQSYGICQWNSGTAAGNRYGTLISWCQNNGYSYTSLTGQLQYMKHELLTYPYYKYSELKNSIPNTADGAYQAALLWAKFFEGCSSSYYVARADLAKNTYWPLYGNSSSGNTGSANTATPVNPEGHLDNIIGGNGCVTVSGWALDRNSVETPLSIHVYVGGPYNSAKWGTSSVVANLYRHDVELAIPGVGDYHGFSATIELPDNLTGEQIVYVYAINVGGSVGTNYNTCLGSKTVTIEPKAIDTPKPTATPKPTVTPTPSTLPSEWPEELEQYADVTYENNTAVVTLYTKAFNAMSIGVVSEKQCDRVETDSTFAVEMKKAFSYTEVKNNSLVDKYGNKYAQFVGAGCGNYGSDIVYEGPVARFIYENVEEGTEFLVVYNPEDYDDTTSASEIVKLRAGTTIAPTQSPSTEEHTVVFIIDGKIVSMQSVKHGLNAEVPKNPIKESDEDYVYHFIGWDKSYKNVEENLIITALFEAERINKYILGDVNADNTINANDALYVLRYVARLSDLSENQVKSSDVNIDGNINATDALMILKYAAKLIAHF